MRLAPPVTSTVLSMFCFSHGWTRIKQVLLSRVYPCASVAKFFAPRYTTGSPCTSTSAGSTPSAAGCGRRPVQLAHNQKMAVLELNSPDTAPIMRGLHLWDASPAPSIESIIIDHDNVSMVANTRPRNSSETRRSNCEVFSTELTAIAARDIAINTTASAKLGIWLNTTYAPPWIT